MGEEKKRKGRSRERRREGREGIERGRNGGREGEEERVEGLRWRKRRRGRLEVEKGRIKEREREKKREGELIEVVKKCYDYPGTGERVFSRTFIVFILSFLIREVKRGVINKHHRSRGQQCEKHVWNQLTIYTAR